MSEPQARVGDLLSGPRGRELCARLTGLALPRDGVQLVPVPGQAGAGPAGQDDGEQPTPLPPDRDDPLTVIPALAEVIEDAGYWGASPAADPLDHPDVLAELRPVAGRLAGYLSTAGRALPVGAARTLLAGWNPDETYWLTDVLTAGGPARAWHNRDRTPSAGRKSPRPPESGTR